MMEEEEKTQILETTQSRSLKQIMHFEFMKNINYCRQGSL